MKTRLLALIVLVVSFSACSKDDSPTTPAPTPIPNYTGIWSGTYTVTACTQTGTLALANLCSTLGNTAAFVLNAAQNGTTQTVQGTFTLGTIPFTIVPATVTSTGTLTFSGTNLTSGITILATWNLTSPIVGNLTQVWSSSALTGQLNLTTLINSGVIKTGSVATRPAPVLLSLEDVARAIRSR